MGRIDTVRRRSILAALGTATVAGCLSDDADDGTDDEPTDDAEPTETAGGDGETTTETASKDRETADDVEEDASDAGTDENAGDETGTDGATDESDDGDVLVSIDRVYEWYQEGSARFVDARGLSQYADAHIEGAVPSPAPDGLAENDPVEEWPTDQRIVTYCGCPHHLSTMRAESLVEDGYEDVQALDEGFYEWRDRGYPLEGDEVEHVPPLRVVAGSSDPADAGEMTMAEHEPSGQLEAAPIDEDGAYELHLRFADVDRESPIAIETPSYRVEAPLGDLTDGRITQGGDVER